MFILELIGEMLIEPYFIKICSSIANQKTLWMHNSFTEKNILEENKERIADSMFQSLI